MDADELPTDGLESASSKPGSAEELGPDSTSEYDETLGPSILEDVSAESVPVLESSQKRTKCLAITLVTTLATITLIGVALYFIEWSSERYALLWTVENELPTLNVFTFKKESGGLVFINVVEYQISQVYDLDEFRSVLEKVSARIPSKLHRITPIRLYSMERVSSWFRKQCNAEMEKTSFSRKEDVDLPVSGAIAAGYAWNFLSYLLKETRSIALFDADKYSVRAAFHTPDGLYPSKIYFHPLKLLFSLDGSVDSCFHSEAHAGHRFPEVRPNKSRNPSFGACLGSLVLGAHLQNIFVAPFVKEVFLVNDFYHIAERSGMDKVESMLGILELGVRVCVTAPEKGHEFDCAELCMVCRILEHFMRLNEKIRILFVDKVKNASISWKHGAALEALQQLTA